MPDRNPPLEFSLLGDQPSRDAGDPLAFDRIASDIAALILRSRDATPLALGVEGPWGAGKSTLMGVLQDRLAGEGAMRSVRFNAWTADDGRVIEAFVKTVLNQIDGRALRRAIYAERLFRWTRVLSSMFASIVGLGSTVDMLWTRVSEDPRARNELRDLIERAVEGWRGADQSGHGGQLLCVFIDDLDRCSPEVAMSVLEAMKLYLDVPGMVFIVGYDEDILSDVVLERKGYEEVQARRYLEKFIQVTYRIQRSSDEQLVRLTSGYLSASGTLDLLGENERRLVIEESDANPRRIKRFINRFVLDYGLDPRWRQFRPQGLVRVLLLRMYFPQFAELLERPWERDPIEDFLSYSRARDHLRSGEPLDRDSMEDVRAALSNEGVTVPVLAAGTDREEILRRLEESVRVQFRNASDEGRRFIDLVTALREESDWPVLRDALASGDLPESSVQFESQYVPARRRRRRFEGLRILWVDDEMPKNRRTIDSLREGGADLWLAEDTAEMERYLDAASFDVLISDIDREEDENAGFEAVEHLASAERTPPYVAFYALRATQRRLNRAKELDAELFFQENKLFDYLEGILEDD